MRTDPVAKYLSEDPATPRFSSLRFDDLASLVAGVKSVVYTTFNGRGDERLLDSLCRDLKLSKLLLGANKQVCSGSRTVDVLIGTDPRKLAAASKHGGRRMSEEWGAALDYPECCVKAYVNWHDSKSPRDLIAHTFANSPRGRLLPFLLNNVYNYYSRLFEARDAADYPAFTRLNRGYDLEPVLPWHPCSYGCRRSLAGGGKIYEVLAHYVPNMAAFRRASLGKPVLFFDKYRFAVLDGACRKKGRGFEAEYQGLCKPKSLLAPGTEKALNRCARLSVSPGGKVTADRPLSLPADCAFLPFSSDWPPGPGRPAHRAAAGAGGADALRERAQAALAARKPAEAEHLLRRALRLQPGVPHYHLLYSQACAALGRQEAALEHAGLALQPGGGLGAEARSWKDRLLRALKAGEDIRRLDGRQKNV